MSFIPQLWCLEENQQQEGVQGPGVAGLRFPSWSPDSKWIAFSLYGDIWKVAASGGVAQRLTFHQADDLKPRWSPDGKSIAFASNRTGNFDIWLMPSEGGTPTQLTFHSTWDSISDWTPDGNWIIFHSYRSGDLEIWKVRKEGGIPVQVTFDGGRDASVSPDGSQIVYVRGDASLWTKGYKGSGNWDLYTISLKDKEPPKQLTTFEGNDLSPCYSPDGKMIFFLREDDVITKSGQKLPTYNLWQMSAAGENPTRITNFDTEIASPHFTPDGKKIVFEKDFRIWQIDFVEKKGNLVPITIQSDMRGEQEELRMLTDGNEMGHWSQNGEEIVFALQGDIWFMSARGGEARPIIRSRAKDQWPRLSPDGKFLSYFSNKSGNNDIYIIDLKTGEELQLTNHQADDFYQSWSPDGKSIVFSSERSGNRDIWLISSKGGIPRQLTDGPESEDDAVFSPDGKWIAFDSGKGGNQEIWIMPTEGNFKDAVQVTNHGGLTQVPSWSPDSKWLAYEHNDDQGLASIWVTPYTGGQSFKVTDQASLPCWSPDGKWILYESERTGQKNLYRVEAPVAIKTSERIPFFAKISVNLAQERRDVFEEAWQAIYQDFYDPKFHGVDWKEVKKKYEAVLPYMETELDFGVLVNKMMGELRASHTGMVEPGMKSPVQTGYVGWELEEVAGYEKVLRVKDVLKDGPADKAWIRRGDYVFQIAGEEVSSKIALDRFLNNQIRKEVKVYISPTLEPRDGRYVSVIPVDMDHIEVLKYHHRLKERIQIVRQGGQGKVVYLHLSEMNVFNLRKFREVVMETADRAAGMILDIRNNGGGNIHQELLDVLSRKPYVSFQARGQAKRYQPMLYWDKPVVVLINEKSYSDAEVFAYAFKTLKRGYLVGTPTAGGVIGTRDITLPNQISFRVPRVGYYSLQGENLEGLGIKPDFIVPETPKDRLENRDPQLLKAIQVLMGEIEKQEKSETAPKEPVEPENKTEPPASQSEEQKVK